VRWWVAAGVVALLAGCSGDEKPGVDVTVLRGEATTVTPNQNAMSFTGKKVAGPALKKLPVDGSYVVTGASWFDGHTWHDTDPPACLAPGSRRQKVELGIVQVKAYKDAPGHPVVVWLKCLEIPPP
jgi:hypothetical protein